ncbi:g2498, partial [Coccomyxa viridis]
ILCKSNLKYWDRDLACLLGVQRMV